LNEAIGDRRDVDVYICGLKAMVDDVRAMLKGMGFDRKQIIYEKYD
jgi:CDP-4-dehydro-6-deoxyglucose reductase